MSVISYILKQRDYKLNFIANPWFVQQFGAEVTYLRAWVCAISALLNSTLILLRDWPFYSVETWWSFMLEIFADIFFIGFFGGASVITIGLFSWFLAIIIKSFFETSDVFIDVRNLEDWQHIEAVLQERIVNAIFILSEAFMLYTVIKHWDAWGPRL